MEAIVLDQNSPIGHLVVGDPVHVPGDGTLGETARRMREENVSAVIVGPEGAIATERDLAWALAGGLGPEDPISAVASTHPLRVDASTPVITAAAHMLNHHVRHLVVERADGSDAVVSLRAIVAAFLQMASPHIWFEALRMAVTSPPETWLG